MEASDEEAKDMETVEEELVSWWAWWKQQQQDDIDIVAAANCLYNNLMKITNLQGTATTANNSDNNNEDGQDTSEPQAKRRKKVTGDIKQLAILIAKECPEQLRKSFSIIFDDGNGEKLLMDGADADVDRIETCSLPIRQILLGDSIVLADRFSREDAYKKEMHEKVQSTLHPVPELEQALEKIFKSRSSGSLPSDNNDKRNALCDSCRSFGVPSFDEDFVHAEANSQIEGIQFPLDPEKGSALVVSGESGSGKSWFAKRYLKEKKFPHASFIYYEIDKDDKVDIDSSPKNSDLGLACKEAMRVLEQSGVSGFGTPAYDLVSERSQLNNVERNLKAKEVFNELICKALNDSEDAMKWWADHTAKQTISELVIIIDEVGKAPNLARGLIDEVRQIYCNIRNQGLAKKVLLVLVGAGIDHFIKDDTPDFAVESHDDKEFLASRTKFGTDPSKSQVAILKGPNLERETIFGIPREEIVRGTYSRVLATNTRMLTRGVIPIYKSQLNCLQVDDLSARRTELGSTNIAMDYAARVYIELNGLKDLEMEKRDALLLQQFGLLLLQELKNANAGDVRSLRNPAHEELLEFLANYLKHLQFESVLRHGLVTSKIQSTSNALRYLACKGNTAPLNAQDGIAFEVILQHHLVRLSKAQQYLQAEADGQNNQQQTSNYWCGRYNLVQAWPPPSTKGGEQLSTREEVDKEVKARYSKEQSKRPGDDDVAQIASRVKNKTDFDLVMRQTVSNVQGADVMVLSSTGGEVSLDLYQAKHYGKVPSCGSQKTVDAFASLGVKYTPPSQDGANKGVVEVVPEGGSEGGSAAYSSAGTTRFVEELSKRLGKDVKVRNRVVAFSAKWGSFLAPAKWELFDFHSARTNNVWIWTKEMMEPTISALTPCDPVPSE